MALDEESAVITRGYSAEEGESNSICLLLTRILSESPQHLSRPGHR